MSEENKETARFREALERWEDRDILVQLLTDNVDINKFLDNPSLLRSEPFDELTRKVVDHPNADLHRIISEIHTEDGIIHYILEKSASDKNVRKIVIENVPRILSIDGLQERDKEILKRLAKVKDYQKFSRKKERKQKECSELKEHLESIDTDFDFAKSFCEELYKRLVSKSFPQISDTVDALRLSQQELNFLLYLAMMHIMDGFRNRNENLDFITIMIRFGANYKILLCPHLSSERFGGHMGKEREFRYSRYIRRNYNKILEVARSENIMALTGTRQAGSHIPEDIARMIVEY